MKSKHWLYIFLVVVIVYFTGMGFQNDIWQNGAKPLLILSLLGYFLAATKGIKVPLKILVALALLFSVMGDTLLLFSNSNERFFILGLISFLVAHLFYIVCFHKIKMRENLEGYWPAAVIVGAYYGMLMFLLVPHLGGLKIPVLVYGIVISFMLFLATQLYQLKDNLTARFILTGAVFFVVSDSVLAINKFYKPYAWGGWVIMTTYLLAQWLLVKGLARYICNMKT